MKLKTNILCLKGFINIQNIKNNNVYIYENKELYTKTIHTVKEEPHYSVLLATNTNLVIDTESNVTGSILEEDTIKNHLERTPFKFYKEDDYIFTPFLDITPPVHSSHFKLDSSLVYTDLDLIQMSKEKDKPLKDLIDDLIQEERDSESSYLKTMPSSLEVNEGLIDFILASMLRGRFKKDIYKENGCSHTSFKLSFRFKTNEVHSEIKSKLESFLKNNEISYSITDYDNYCYLNIINKPLFGFFKKIEDNSYSDLKTINKNLQKYFINHLFKYTKNNFYTTPDTYHVIKEICYNNQQVISFIKRSQNDTDVNPICCSVINKDASEHELYPDVVYLEDGYLTRIVKIDFNTSKSKVIKNHLIIG